MSGSVVSVGKSRSIVSKGGNESNYREILDMFHQNLQTVASCSQPVISRQAFNDKLLKIGGLTTLSVLLLKALKIVTPFLSSLLLNTLFAAFGKKTHVYHGALPSILPSKEKLEGI